jgi:DNA-binding Lrp family transcriptional regulator
MKDVRLEILRLLKAGYCTPQIARLSAKLQIPAATIHYNVKKLESSGTIKSYKAVLDHKKAGEGFCVFILITLEPQEYEKPERIAKEISGFPQVESCDIVTGDWEIILKVRTAGIEEYYEFVKRVLSKKGIGRIKTLSALHSVKSEFVES